MRRFVRKAKKAANGRKFAALMAGDTTGHASQSECDLGLLNLLAYWTGGNPAQMDRISRTSGLMRGKWDRPAVRPTYGALQIEKAIGECGNAYDPGAYRKKSLIASSQMEGTSIRPI